MTVSQMVFCNDCFYKRVAPNVQCASDFAERHAHKTQYNHDVGCYVLTDNMRSLQEICRWNNDK